jgi:hypothetical protein
MAQVVEHLPGKHKVPPNKNIKVTTKRNCGYLVLMHQCRFINCEKYSTLGHRIDNVGCCASVKLWV